MSIWVAILAFVATSIQFVVTMYQLATADRQAVDHLVAAEQLLNEVPRRHVRRRQQAKHDLRALSRGNSPELQTGIWRIKLTMASWALLWAASLVALVNAFLS